MGLGLTLWHGQFENWETVWLRWCDQQGRVIPTGAERAEHEREAPNTNANSPNRSNFGRIGWPPSSALGVNPDERYAVLSSVRLLKQGVDPLLKFCRPAVPAEDSRAVDQEQARKGR